MSGFGAPASGRQDSGGPADRMSALREEPPPIGKTWRRLYASVILFLAFQIALFYLFTKAFA